MRKTFRRQNYKKRIPIKLGTKKHYKAGVINRVATLRDFFDSRPGPDLTPFIVEPYAVTKVSSAYRAHYTRSKISYAKSIVPFLKWLQMLHMVLGMNVRNPLPMITIKTNLLLYMPDGLILENFLSIPNLNNAITELSTKLNENFIIPRQGTNDHRQLFRLVVYLRTVIQEALAQHIVIPRFNPHSLAITSS